MAATNKKTLRIGDSSFQDADKGVADACRMPRSLGTHPTFCPKTRSFPQVNNLLPSAFFLSSIAIVLPFAA